MAVIFSKNSFQDIFGDTNGVLFGKRTARNPYFTCYKPSSGPLRNDFGYPSNDEEYHRLVHRMRLQSAKISSMLNKTLENTEVPKDIILVLTAGCFYVSVKKDNSFVLLQVNEDVIIKTLLKKLPEDTIFSCTTWYVQNNPKECLMLTQEQVVRITKEQYDSILDVLIEMETDIDETCKKVEQEIHETWQ